MTIEDLSIVATDQENFSLEGTVVVKLGDVLHEPTSFSYNEQTKQLIIEI